MLIFIELLLIAFFSISSSAKEISVEELPDMAKKVISAHKMIVDGVPPETKNKLLMLSFGNYLLDGENLGLKIDALASKDLTPICYQKFQIIRETDKVIKFLLSGDFQENSKDLAGRKARLTLLHAFQQELINKSLKKEDYQQLAGGFSVEKIYCLQDVDDSEELRESLFVYLKSLNNAIFSQLGAVGLKTVFSLQDQLEVLKEQQREEAIHELSKDALIFALTLPLGWVAVAKIALYAPKVALMIKRGTIGLSAAGAAAGGYFGYMAFEDQETRMSLDTLSEFLENIKSVIELENDNYATLHQLISGYSVQSENQLKAAKEKIDVYIEELGLQHLVRSL